MIAARWADMPISAPVVLWIAYAFGMVGAALLATVGGYVAAFTVIAVAVLSFQFWTFAAYRGRRWVDALLPTIAAMVRQAQAEALESAASDWAADPDAVGDSEKDARNWLRDRADALRLTTDPLDVTHDAP